MSTNGSPGYTVLGLHAENVRKLKVISIYPPAVGVVKVKGRNAAGKSSTLDAIQFALGGKSVQPAKPIRDGESSAVVVADLGGKFAVKRTWTANDKTYLTVERRDDGVSSVVARPAEFLESLCGTGISFDPLAFTQKKPAEQVQMLLDVLRLPEDPRELDKRRKSIFDERTQVNRQAKNLEGALETTPKPPEGTPDAEVSPAELLATFQERQATVNTNATTRRDLQEIVDGVTEIEQDCALGVSNAVQKVDDLKAALIEAEAELAEAKMTAADMVETAKTQAQQAAEAIAALVDPDLAEIQQQMATIEQTNAAVRLKLSRKAQQDEIGRVWARADALTKQIGEIDDKKVALFQQATLPVPDLAIGDDGKGGYVVTYRTIPIQDCSSSEQLRISMALAMALNPKVRVVLVREGSLLDDEAKATLEAIAKDQGFQIWMEIVGTEPEDGAFVIEEGQLVEA